MEQKYTKDDTFLARWLNNELSDAELDRFQKSEDFEIYQKIAEKSTKYTIPEFNEELVFDKIKSQISFSKTKVRKLVPTWVYATAAAVLLLLGLTFFINSNTSYNSLRGEQLACVLPDGSEVKLNGNSSVNFNKKNWEKGERTLELEGEAYFKVQKGSTFSVKTKEGTVTVLGTQFNVQTLANYLAVECYEGRVNVKNSSVNTVLTPGKGVKVLGNIKEDYNIQHIKPNWLVHKYQYNGVPLSIVFRDLENVYNIEIKIEDIDLKQKYSGKLITRDLEKALKIICKPMNINFKIKDTVVLIKN